ncbi:MAG: hypothetical protein GTN84_00330 [Hydrogenophaga sp.]|jgi:hypothetical protein|uniref:hypothetical protein n=1 Tax=Hydrogenophaga sp. TaxID=1904254 RepID=UPI0016982342|nr:hypothetical protein [Hydrogenophaga sp.]NIU61523.1 hypothetical protein [Stutzerimonas stutzeri]NIM39598.1 hypothetical protein [Hydrogenophaga sp.]NIN24802.1 hypothetical protein [Hydrogenophaga sp.]NIN29314.1 hypothetical protein [Hydrogenophaga sp.]NIN53837.1 hypothetical protein [Hydrogenophaga sp.]
MASLTMDHLRDTSEVIMRDSEDRLFEMLESISSGEDVSNADLLKYQIELSINSLTATITSSIVKERSDTLKAVVQKF